MNCGNEQLTDPSLFLVIVILIQLTSQTEIGHFDDAIGGQQNIPGRQIAVQNLFTGEIFHTAGDLKKPRNQLTR